MRATRELCAAFARRLAAVSGREVPAYETLVEVTCEINAEVVDRDAGAAQRLGSVERVSAERHGAIRVGTPRELSEAARVFAAFGMHPVGFYDLREAGPSPAAARLASSRAISRSAEGLRLTASSVPVVSTAFRRRRGWVSSPTAPRTRSMRPRGGRGTSGRPPSWHLAT